MTMGRDVELTVLKFIQYTILREAGLFAIIFPITFFFFLSLTIYLADIRWSAGLLML